MNPILSIRNLKKIYGKGCAFCLDEITTPLAENQCPHCSAIVGCSHITFDVYPGEVLGIVGESGSGKSTVLKGINLMSPVTSGEIWLNRAKNGKMDILKADAQTRREIQNIYFGFVHQNPLNGLNFMISGEGNVAERMLVAGDRNFQHIREKVHGLLRRVALPPSRYKEFPGAYSGGMQQRVQIAKALINAPCLVLLDEPTGGLDVSVQAKILDLIRSIARELKVAMVMVSHDMKVVRLLSQRLIVMKNGRMVESGLTDRVIDDPKEAYTQMLVHSTIQ